MGNAQASELPVPEPEPEKVASVAEIPRRTNTKNHIVIEEDDGVSKYSVEEPIVIVNLVDNLPSNQSTSPQFVEQDYEADGDSKNRVKGRENCWSSCCSCLSRKKSNTLSTTPTTGVIYKRSTITQFNRMSSGDEGGILHRSASQRDSVNKLDGAGSTSSSSVFKPPEGNGLMEGSETTILAKILQTPPPPHPNPHPPPPPPKPVIAVSSKTRHNKPRRTRIPNRPDVSLSLWNVMKNAIGKDLSKLPLPVNFNEPLSMLQRLTEDYEYASVLDAAADSHVSCDQMAFVAAFVVSSYASTAVRTGKPFNPLLGETFECDRMNDLGFKCFCEQVSHHPPTVALYCTGHKWTCWQEFTMTSRFTGNAIEVTPHGVAHLLFPDSGNHYTWKKVTSVVHNIILGSLWVDQQGDMEISNHTTGDKCHLRFIPCGMFGGNNKKVEGTVSNKHGHVSRTLAGHWDKQMESFEVLSVSSSNKYTLGPSKILWTRKPPPPESEKFYYFTLLACQLNEMEDGVAPTDSRRRPDQRLMEDGHFEEANLEKVRLEEKQRIARKARLAAEGKAGVNSGSRSNITKSSETEVNLKDGGEPGYSPAWFKLQKDPITNKAIHIFTGEYWSCKETQNWSRCPQIF